jgi:RNA polymerase sigma factor (sigma-70 family)
MSTYTENINPTTREELVIENYFPLARSIAYSRTWCRPVEDSEEYADALVMLVVCANQWNPSKGSFPLYARIRMNGAVIDGQRARNGGRKALRAGIKFTYESLDYVDPGTVSNDLEVIEVRDEVRAYLNTLSPRNRTIISMVYENVGYREIAEAVCLHERSISNLHKHILTLLRSVTIDRKKVS